MLYEVITTAVRAGSAETAMYCLESRKEMPASEEEIEEAMEEHIDVNNSRNNFV